MNNKQRKLSKHNQEVRQSRACSDFEVTAPLNSDYIVMGGVGTFSHPDFRGRVDLRELKGAFFFQMVTMLLAKLLSSLAQGWAWLHRDVKPSLRYKEFSIGKERIIFIFIFKEHFL